MRKEAEAAMCPPAQVGQHCWPPAEARRGAGGRFSLRTSEGNAPASDLSLQTREDAFGLFPATQPWCSFQPSSDLMHHLWPVVGGRTSFLSAAADLALGLLSWMPEMEGRVMGGGGIAGRWPSMAVRQRRGRASLVVSAAVSVRAHGCPRAFLWPSV